jgi:hypothetical protein
MITVDQVKSELDLSNADYDEFIENLISSVEGLWDEYTNKKWSESVYEEKFYDLDCKTFYLRAEAIQRIYYATIGQDAALTIENTNANSISTVSIGSESLYLIDNVTETELSFDTYDDISSLAAQITAQTDWIGSAVSGYGSQPSYKLLPTEGTYVDETKVDFYVPDEYATKISFDPTRRSVTLLYSGAPTIIKYKAGYTEDTIPSWLAQILIRQTAHWYLQAQEKRWHVSSATIGDNATISYKNQKNNLLPDFLDLANRHRFINV